MVRGAARTNMAVARRATSWWADEEEQSSSLSRRFLSSALAEPNANVQYEPTSERTAGRLTGSLLTDSFCVCFEDSLLFEACVSVATAARLG